MAFDSGSQTTLIQVPLSASTAASTASKARFNAPKYRYSQGNHSVLSFARAASSASSALKAANPNAANSAIAETTREGDKPRFTRETPEAGRTGPEEGCTESDAARAKRTSGLRFAVLGGLFLVFVRTEAVALEVVSAGHELVG